MGLLSQLGLAVPATLMPKALATPASGVNSAVQTSGASARSTPPQSKVEPVNKPATGQDPLGPSADGPDLEQLYVLRGPDGRSPLDASNSKMGARLNEVGQSLASAFGRAADTYTSWLDKFQAVMKQSTLSEQELKKMTAAKNAFVNSMGRDDMRGKSNTYVTNLDDVKKAVRDVGPVLFDASAAVKHVGTIFARRDLNDAEHKRDEAKDKLEDRKEEIKEEQERFKGALSLITKFADVEHWVDIVPEALAFANEQIFAQLPKNEIKQLKKDVEKATAKVHEAQADVITADLDEAYDRINAANSRLENAREDVEDRVKALMRSTADAIARLSTSDATRDVAVMIAGSRKMTQLMAQASLAGSKYLDECAALLAECPRVAEQYVGYQSIVRSNKTLVTSEVDAMVESAKLNVDTLKSWIAYLRSVQSEVKDGVADCRDTSDKGYMKNYSHLGSAMQDMLSGQ